MPSTYSNLKIQLMATGENNTTWGTVTNTNLGTAIEEAIVGSTDVVFASGNVTLSLSDTNGSQPARNLRLNLTGATGGSSRNLVVPSIEKPYIVNNGCADNIVVKTAAGSGITVPPGKTMWVYSDGTNVVDVMTHLTSVTLGTPLPLASGGLGNGTGNGSALTNLNASNVASGTLSVTYGGTGASTNSAARVNLLPAYTGNAGKLLALNAGGTDVEWVSAGGSGTVTSVNATTAISGLSFSGGPITSAGTLTLNGTLGVQGGGTGQTSYTNGQLLIGNSTGNTLTKATLTAGSGITITNGAGSITIASTAGAVSSVSGSGSGISVSPTTGNVVVSNTGVTSITAGSGISVSGSTGAVTISATGGSSGTVALDDGLSSSPSLYFSSDTNTGMYRVGNDWMALVTGGSVRVGINDTGVSVTNTLSCAGLRITSGGGAPATSSSTGSSGQIAWDSSYLYVCVATNSWKRIALTTF